MSEQPGYHRDGYLHEMNVDVRAIEESEGRRFARLSDSLLYPGGGGQPPDRGRLGDVPIVGAARDEKSLRCEIVGDASLEPGEATLQLDWPRRFDHMQQHSAQHLLTAVAADRFGWPTTSFHLHELASGSPCDIEVDAQSISDEALTDLEDAVAAEIRAGRLISDRRVSTAEFEAPEVRNRVRTRGLPAGHTGDVRLVEIEGIDLAACGGTHLRSTSEIGGLKLLGVEKLRGGLRLTWVAGRRVRQRLGDHEKRAAELRRLFGAADSEIAGVAAGKLDQLKALDRQNRRLQSQVAELTAETLKASGAAFVERHFDGANLNLLGQLARTICDDASTQTAFFTGQDDSGGYLLLSTGGATAVDVQALGREIAPLLEGRGGGSGRIFQGRAGSFDRRDEALRLISNAVESAQ